MKREVLCTSCGGKLMRMFATTPPTPGEHHRIVRGLARRAYRCDGCFAKIPEGATCALASIWSESTLEYYEWEREYIEILKESATI